VAVAGGKRSGLSIMVVHRLHNMDARRPGRIEAWHGEGVTRRRGDKEEQAMKAAVIERPGRLVMADRDPVEPAAHEVRIRVMASGICGTDLHIYSGDYLGTYPVIPGHEISGIVDAVGAHTSRLQPGDRVAVEPNIACDNCRACLNNRQNFCENWQAIGVTLPGGMAECVVAPEKAVFPLGDVSFEAGAFVEPLSCVLHGIERTGVRLGDRVLVVGAGPIGILLTQTILLQGAFHITQVDRVPERLSMASQCGARDTERSVDALPDGEFDVVVDATGVPALMAETVRLTRPGGTVLLFGVPPQDAQLALEAFPIFRKGLTILSSYTSVRNSLQAVRIIRSGRIDVAPLVSHRLPLDELEHGLSLAESGADGAMKVQILPNGAPEGV